MGPSSTARRSPEGLAPAASQRATTTTTCALALLVILVSAPSFSQSPLPGDLVINEILADPAPGAAGDANGDGITDANQDEFVEIVNVSGSNLDLSGLTLNDSTGARHEFPLGTMVPPLCAVVVFGGGSPTGPFGGALVQTASSGTLSLGNAGESVALIDGTTEIDIFIYGGAGCEGDQDQSVTLDPDLNGVCTLHSLAAGSGGSLFSPGTRVDGSPFGPCTDEIFADGFEAGDSSAWSAIVPTPPPLVINEIMQNPFAVSDTFGEWFELFNPGDTAVNINGWTITDEGIDLHVIDAGGSLLVPAGGFAVLGIDGNPAANGGVAVDYVYSGIALANSADEIVLLDAHEVEVDRVRWDDGATFPDPNGASMALADPGLDNSVGANWCESVSPFGAGDLGTPGSVNDLCP